ncbi:MAG: hypothetical protein FWE37_05915 [Spirochaetaceae bacterium]|nr:hypothetical protein [Spirochaetaceae bacterium]
MIDITGLTEDKYDITVDDNRAEFQRCWNLQNTLISFGRPKIGLSYTL